VNDCGAGMSADSSTVNSKASLPMVSLTLPIIGESVFRTLVGSADTIMLSSFKDSAVAAVGMMNQYIFFTLLLFNVICIGASIVLSQYISAGKADKVEKVTKASTVMCLATGATVTLFAFLATRPILSLYKIEDDVRLYATQYFMIYGGVGALVTSFNMLQGAILRSYGYTKDTLVGSITANVINVVGNAIAIYVIRNGYEVIGTAASSVLAQLVSCILYAWRIRAHPDVKMPLKHLFSFDKESLHTVLKIGVPTAGESISYNVASITIMAMVTTLGTTAMSAMVYAQTIASYMYLLASSIGSAVQIKTGYFVGAGQAAVAYKKVYKYQLVGTLCSIVAVLAINLFSYQIVSLFTHNDEIISQVRLLLLIDIYYEFGRSLNLATISALKGSGDVRFPVLFGICSMWGIMVLGAYIFGIKLGLGLPAIWFCNASDEFVRGVVMICRWKSKRWMSKAIG